MRKVEGKIGLKNKTFFLYFLEESTKDPGRCDSPRTPNAAQVWYAATATNRGNLKPRSLCSLARQIPARFSQVCRHL